MRRLLATAAVITLIVFLGLSSETLAGLRAEGHFSPQAGGNDTLVVYANGPTIDQVINSDTTTSGQQAHSVYKLVSLDTTYVFLGQITPRSDVTFLGVLGSDGRPPCVQPGVLNDGSIPKVLFNLNRKGLTATFKNLYIEDLSTNSSNSAGGQDILVMADSVKVNMDNVISDDDQGVEVGYTGNWDDFFITNCKFRNGVNPPTWTGLEILAPIWPAVPAVDSIVMKYNTLFCDNAYAVVAKPPARYVDFSHNSIVFSFLQPFFIFAAFHAKIDNNILYGAFVGGETKSEYPWWDEEFSPAPPSIIDFDTMNVASDKVFDPADSGKSNWRMLAEGKRTVEVENNDFFEPQAITNFWTAWDDTAKTGDSLYTPPWMNARTTHMFNDPTDWPGFKASGNMIGVDPGYGPSFANVLQGGGNYGVGLLPYFTMIRTAQSPTIGWGYQIQSIPSGNTNWIPYWPLPEAADMQYTNASMRTGGTDGKAIGDPGWFTGGITAVKQQIASIPTEFSLSNNYPNPFNPSTVIKVSLKEAGIMSLDVYNVLGQLVKVVDQGYKAPGVYSYDVNMNNFASGVYFYTLRQGSNMIAKKMILLK
ncbi:MAG: T9SS type A sorting domain-containing protein [Bacteroidetes bacterium]|nr:T9SS type A sorting domain-containing protein [Bacteroidota bacterium]